MCQLFFSKCILFGKSINYCCTLVVMAKQQKIWSTKCVFWSRMRGGGVRKTKTSWVSLPDGHLRPPALPHQDPCCHVVRYECHIFLCFLWFLCCKVFHSADRLTDRQTLWKFDCNPSASLLSVWEAVCCICQMKCQYTPSKTNKQTNKKCLWTDFFVLLFCKCTVKHIWWPLPVLILVSESIRQCMHLGFFFNRATVAISCLSWWLF